MKPEELSYDFPLHDYMDLLTAEIAEFYEIDAREDLTDEERLWVSRRGKELKEELRYFKNEFLPEAAKRQGITLINWPAPASPPEASPEPPLQAHPVVEQPEEEEPELEEEEYSENEEEEEGEWSDDEPREMPPFTEEFLTDELITPIRIKLEKASIIEGDPIIGMTNEHVRGFMLKMAYKKGVKTILDFYRLDWYTIFTQDDEDDEPEAEEPIVIEDSYDKVSGTVLVRTGDIIEIKTVDPSRAHNNTKVHSSEHSVEPEVIVKIGTPLSAVIEDVAHHTEPKETSIDAARDELFINTEDQAADEFSEGEKLSVSIDATPAVDRHREDNELDEISQNYSETPVSVDDGKTVDRQQEENCPNELSVQPSVQNEFTNFIFPPESHQPSQDIPVFEEASREDDAWSYVRSLPGVVVFIKNCAKRLSARINRRRTKGALAQPFDSLD